LQNEIEYEQFSERRIEQLLTKPMTTERTLMLASDATPMPESAGIKCA